MKIFSLFLMLVLPFCGNAQLSDFLQMMKAEEDPRFRDYESVVFDATEYVFNHPVDVESKEFMAATEIISFWVNKDTGIRIPAFGSFYKILTNENQQQFLYVVAMYNHILDQKLNHGRFLECKQLQGQKFSEQADVREVQLEGAKTLLKYVGDRKNNVYTNPKTKKYIKAYNKGTLEDILFDD